MIQDDQFREICFLESNFKDEAINNLKKMSNKKRMLSKKVYSRVTPETYKRLDDIKIKYGYKSVYEIVQGLIHCFLRVADPANDQQIESIPYDIEQMFTELSEAEKHVEFDKPKRKYPYKTVNDEQK